MGTYRVNFSCTICGAKAYCRQLCKMHYQRLWRHGDPRIVFPAGDHAGPGSSHWTGDEATRRAAHQRVKSQRGRAGAHRCAHCGEQALDWAYNHRCPNERTCPDTGFAYSTDVAQYVPLCRTCHRRFDLDPGDPRWLPMLT